MMPCFAPTETSDERPFCAPFFIPWVHDRVCVEKSSRWAERGSNGPAILVIEVPFRCNWLLVDWVPWSSGATVSSQGVHTIATCIGCSTDFNGATHCQARHRNSYQDLNLKESFDTWLIEYSVYLQSLYFIFSWYVYRKGVWCTDIWLQELHIS